jgi:hypothetical protein
MKLKFLLVLTVLLLLASIASAAPASPAATPAAPAATDSSFMTPAALSPGRSAPALSFLNPVPADRVAICGSYSPTICAGHQTSSSCGLGKWCQVSDSCSSGGWTCYCGAAA